MIWVVWKGDNMNYKEMGDFDIDGAVLTALGYVKLTSGYGYVVYLDQLRRKEVGAKTSKKFNFNPCNNPLEAWPIITGNKIGLVPVNGTWRASSVIAGYHEQHDDNPLRAAMIVFLMIKDAECQRS